jgi:hypothetical protein
VFSFIERQNNLSAKFFANFFLSLQGWKMPQLSSIENIYRKILKFLLFGPMTEWGITEIENFREQIIGGRKKLLKWIIGNTCFHLRESRLVDAARQTFSACWSMWIFNKKLS